MGITSMLPRMTSEPRWFQSVSCCEMKESWLMRASICFGP